MKLEEILLAGIGLISSGRKELKKTIDEAIKEGKIKRKEGEKLVKGVTKGAKELEEEIEEKVSNTLNKAGVATRKDISSLERRMAKLEKKLLGTTRSEIAKRIWEKRKIEEKAKAETEATKTTE